MNLTGNRFSPFIGAVSELWGIGTDNARIPDDEEIVKALSEKKIDLGALGKGYAAEKAKEILQDNSIKSAIINFGGNICCIGSKPNGKSFVIGIQDPHGTRGSYISKVEVSDKSIVTSGNYERYFEIDGIRYCHIMDGLTGKPVDNGTDAVTVIGNDSLICDALSTCCFILGAEESRSLLENYPDYKVVFF